MTELIETPDKVVMEEADFVAKLDVHFEELHKTLADGTPGLDKQQTRGLLNAVIADVWFSGVEEEEQRTKLKT